MKHLMSRRHVVEMCRTMLERGYLKATEGNVSVRIPGHELYAVTPSNYDYDKMRAEDICLVDFRGRHVPDPQGVGGLVPSIECGMHANIYRERPDVNAIVHTHQPYASALAFLRKPIPALTDEQVRFLGREVAIIDYAPSGTGFLARNVQKKVASGDNAFIIANHGVVAVGTDPSRAVFNMALLEKVSIAYLMALTTETGKVYRIPAAIRELAFGKLKKDEKRIAAQITEAVEPIRVPADEELPSVSEVPDIPDGETPGYMISEYPDVPDTVRRLTALVAQPARGLRHDALLDVLYYFDSKCGTSKKISERAEKRIPGGVRHNATVTYPFPLAIAKAEGAHLTDRDGNVYIDFAQAAGPAVLGSDYGPVNDRVAAALSESGPMFHEYEVKLAEAVNRYLPHVEMYRSLGSGTPAVPVAVRAARAHTGRKLVVKVGGDRFPHDLATLRRRLIGNRLRGGTAAVIVEPFGPQAGTRPVPRDYNAAVRRLCDEFGAVLVFDETVTGFRTGLGGAAGYFGVTPDLTVFGSAASGGYPMPGGVGGRADIMSVFGPGGRGGGHLRTGDTGPANPLSCAAGYFAIEEIARTNAPVLAGRAGDRLTRGLQRLIDKYGLPYVAYNQGSVVHLDCGGVLLLDARNARKAAEITARGTLMRQMGAAYAAHGVLTAAGSRMYTSMADTDDVIDDALARFDEVLALVEGV